MIVLCQGLNIGYRQSMFVNNVNILCLDYLDPGGLPRVPPDPDPLLPGLVVSDHSLQITGKCLHNSCHVSFKSLYDNVCQG